MLNGRFEIIEEIGRGSQAVTYRAHDHETGEDVAIKELDFRRVEDWKAQELFEREGATLRSLDHPGIPRYVDAFAVEEGDTIRLFVAQEFIDGESLQDELDSGGRWSEERARSDLDELLEILTYLHELAPPVIHRDIKPSNIMRRADGRLALIDFGAVQNVVPRTVGGSTIIGTPGYMPIEQVMGRAMPGSDLYALGATFIHLLTRTDPTLLPVERNELRFRDRLPDVSSEFADGLEQLARVSIEDRPASGRAVREQLERSTPPVVLVHEPEPEPRPTPQPANGPKSVALELIPPPPTDAVAVGVPGWATSRVDDETTFIEFSARDSTDGLMRAVIEETAGAVEIRVSGLHGPPQEKRPPWELALLLPLTLLGLFGGLNAYFFIGMFALLGAVLAMRRRPTRETRFRLDPEGYALTWDKSSVTGDLNEIDGVTAVGNMLWLGRTNGEPLRLLHLAESEAFRWDWLVYYFNARLAALRGEDVIDHDVEEIAREEVTVGQW